MKIVGCLTDSDEIDLKSELVERKVPKEDSVKGDWIISELKPSDTNLDSKLIEKDPDQEASAYPDVILGEWLIVLNDPKADID